MRASIGAGTVTSHASGTRACPASGAVLEPAAEGGTRAEGAHAVVAGLGDREVVRDRLARRERAARRAARGEDAAVDQLGALERQPEMPLGLPLRRDRDLVVALAEI